CDWVRFLSQFVDGSASLFREEDAFQRSAAVGRDIALRCPRPRTAGGTNQSRRSTCGSRCAAGRGADRAARHSQWNKRIGLAARRLPPLLPPREERAGERRVPLIAKLPLSPTLSPLGTSGEREKQKAHRA